MSVYYCELCRRSAFTGRRKHVYEKGHRDRLTEVLGGFLSKVGSARKMIKAASILKYVPWEHELNFWCHCCEEEVKRHTSDGHLTVLHGGMLEHMFSPEHRKAVNKFCWKHQAGVKLKASLVLTPEEYERFKSSVTKALENYEETEDVLIKEIAAQIREVEQIRRERVQSVSEPETDPTGEDTGGLSSTHTADRAIFMDSEEPGPSGICTPTPHTQPAGTGPGLTFIGHQEGTRNGNVHTGALPPWMKPDEDEEPKKQEIGPSHADFLKYQEKMKLKKLPPNRVGANFNHSAPTEEGWLPSFGRVWNSGRRWQSRHQYREEEEEGGSGKRRRGEEV